MILLYFVLWVIFNANFTLEIAIFGVVISLVIFWFTCKFMDYSIKKEINGYKKAGKYMKYIYHLLVEVVKANLVTIHFIFSQKEEIEPAIVTFKGKAKTPLGKTMIANSITLTPGTITASLEGDTYMVHCLDESYAEGIDDNVFTKIVEEVEKE
ncbi:MAG: Na+/H+ antiporter subunit E [Lachnospiraceae bacterium]